MKDGQELVEETRELSVFDKFESQLVEFEKVNELVEFDLSTFEGEEDCKKHIKNVGKLRIGIEKLRVSTGKEHLEAKRAVDNEAKVWQARIAKIDAVHSVPLKELETKRLNEMMEAREAEQAEERRIQAEKDAELESLRKIVADQEAAQKAKDDEAQAVLDAAEREKEIEEVKQTAAKEAIAEEQRKATEEKQRIINEQLTREADVEHRKCLNNIAVDKLDAITCNTEMSMDIVKAIVSGTIPNVTMNY